MLWGVWESRTREPLVSMKLLRTKPVFTTMVAAGLAVGAISGVATLLPMMLQTPTELAPGYGFGASVTETAYYTLAAGIFTVLGGFFVGWTAKSIGFRNHLAIGAAFIALGSLLLGVAHAESWQIVVFYSFIGIGAIVYAAVPNLVVGAVPVDQQAISAGMVGTAQTLVGSVVTQLVFVVLSNNVSTVVQGFPIYSETGFRNALLLSAAVGLVGAAGRAGHSAWPPATACDARDERADGRSDALGRGELALVERALERLPIDRLIAGARIIRVPAIVVVGFVVERCA